MEPALKTFTDRCTGKKNGKFHLSEAIVNPGEHASLGLPLPELLGYAPLYMPVKIIHGKTEGPTVLLFATMRGDEFNGMEIIQRVTGLGSMDKLKGTLIAVPVLNVFGMLNRSKYLPDGQVLDQAFPGSESGKYGERMAHLFVENLFEQCDLCVEFCSGQINHNFLPHVYTDFDTPGNRELARAFPVSVVVDIDPEPGSLQEVARERGKPMLCYRAGEALRFNQHAIRLGSRGVGHLLRKIGMLPSEGRDAPGEGREPVVSQASEWVYATKSGIAHPVKQLGDKVKKGEVLAKISEPLGSFQEVTVVAPTEGVIVGANDMPLVYEGDYLFRIATFEQLDEAAGTLREWTEREMPDAAGGESTPEDVAS